MPIPWRLLASAAAGGKQRPQTLCPLPGAGRALALRRPSEAGRIWRRFPRSQGGAWSFAAGAALGFVAWGEGRVPLLALVLPVLVAACPSRLQAFWLAAGYAVALLRHALSFISAWFDDRLVVGAAAVMFYAFASALLWACGWSRSPQLPRRMLAITAAWLLALLAGIAVPGHPIIAMGFAWPGSGWCGVLLAAALPALALATWQVMPSPTLRCIALGVALTALALAGLLLPGTAPARAGLDIQAQTTAWGPLRESEAVLQRLERMGARSREASAGTLVWPESILGRYEPALELVLELEVLRPARAAGQTLVIGMDLPTKDGRLRNAAVVFHPDGRRSVALARQPAPVSLWKPWRTSGSFVADWRAPNVVALGQGQRAALIFCYEEYVPLLYLIDEARDAPTLYLALSNTWAARAPAAAAIQTWHSLGMARLFGRPYFKADNRPGP